MAKDSKKKNGGKQQPSTATSLSSDTPLYALGPQSDGSLVVRVPDDSHLVTAIQAFDKQMKNANAATGTIASLKPGMADPVIALVLRELAALKSLFSRARAPENQIKDTPIGEEIAAATAAAVAGEKGEQISGKEGYVWAPHVPKPRPLIGQMIRHPSGAVISVESIDGFDDLLGGFNVKGSDGASYGVIGHMPGPDAHSEIEWRLRGEAYPPPASAPLDALATAGGGVASVDDKLLSDAPTSDDDDSAAALIESGAVEETTDAAGEPQHVDTSKTTSTKQPSAEVERASPKAIAQHERAHGDGAITNAAQRARNRQSAGVARPAQTTPRTQHPPKGKGGNAGKGGKPGGKR